MLKWQPHGPPVQNQVNVPQYVEQDLALNSMPVSKAKPTTTWVVWSYIVSLFYIIYFSKCKRAILSLSQRKTGVKWQFGSQNWLNIAKSWHTGLFSWVKWWFIFVFVCTLNFNQLHTVDSLYRSTYATSVHGPPLTDLDPLSKAMISLNFVTASFWNKATSLMVRF